MNTALDLIMQNFDGRFIATAFMPLSMAREYWRLWVRSGGKNRYASLFEKFTTKRPAYRIYLPIEKHLRVNTQFSPVEIDIINTLHKYEADRYDLMDYYEGKVLDKKSGQIKNIAKVLNDLNSDALKAAIAGANRGQIMDKIRSAFYTIAADGKGKKVSRYAIYDAENRGPADGEIPDNTEVIWDRKTNKPRKIDKQFIEGLGWTELDRLINEYASDPTRENAGASSANLAIVISRHPYDVATVSTGRNWTSCTNLGVAGTPHPGRGSNSHRVPASVQYGTIVAYCVRADDGNIRHPICRASIMPFVNTEDKNDIILDVSSNSSAYGTWPPGFEYVLRKWLNMVNHGNKGGKYKLLSTEPYADRGEDRNMPAVSQDKDLDKWINKIGLRKGSYTIRRDNKVDVNGDVIIKSEHVDSRFMVLPIKFGTVKGSFKAAGCGLASLVGVPDHVEGDFDISSNKITSLEDGPSYVEGSYIASKNSQLTILTGWPEFIGGDAVFENCSIATLRGIPKSGSQVVGSMLFQRNKLRRIDGFPERVDCKVTSRTREDGYEEADQMGRVDFSYNEILTTVGLPTQINGDLMLRNNPKLEDLVGFPRVVLGHVLLSSCPLRDLSVVHGVDIGGTFQFNGGNLQDSDVAKFEPKHIGGGCQFADHYLTKNCPEPPNVDKVFDWKEDKGPKRKHALFLGHQGEEFSQKSLEKKKK